MTYLETQLIFLVVILGFCYFVNKAWKHRKNSYRLKSFFLGGARLGPTLTEHNSIGMTFAWSGGIWFFVTLGFAYGPWVILMQIPWCLSIVVFGLLFSRIHGVTKNKTIHGFLEACYSKNVRIIACIATALGYIFNTGFELYWSGKLLSSIFSIDLISIALPVGILLSLICAIYCSIGGYRANASTDKIQNVLGVISLTLLVLFTSFSSHSTPLIVASIIFMVGSLIYCSISLYFNGELKTSVTNFLSVFSLCLAVIAVIVSLVLFLPKGTVGTPVVLSSSFPPLTILIGIIIFQLFFNLVDMANWQTVAANGDAPKEEHKKLSRSIIRSALYLNWFPALGGALIGLALRASLDVGIINDQNIFHFAFGTIFQGQNEILRGLTFGIIILGLISTTLSTADSYLMAATHTLVYDLFATKRIRELLYKEDIEGEKRIVKWSKGFLFPLSIIMVLVFWLAYKYYAKIGGSALDFQMIMYAFALSILAPVMYGLFKGENKSSNFSKIAFWSILFGLLAAILPYSISVLYNFSNETRNILVNLTPFYSLAISSLVFFVGVFLVSFRKTEMK